MLKPLISVIIPVYNHAAYVEEALDSVALQTYPHLELIIIDDGSKDQSAQKIEAWLKNHPKLRTTFIPQINQGAHASINRGLKIAEGNYLTILNSDDFFHVKRLEILLRQLQNENKEWAFSKVHAVDAAGQTAQRGNWWWRWYEKVLLTHNECFTTGYKLFQDNITVSTGNLFFSRKLFEAVGEFKDLKLAHDYDFAMRALKHAEPLFVREELYFYRLHTGNTAPTVLHLVPQEFSQIFGKYQMPGFLQNVQAPCLQNHPVYFSSYRQKANLDRWLAPSQPAEEEKTRPTFSWQWLKKKSITFLVFDLACSNSAVEMALTMKRQGYAPQVLACYGGSSRTILEKAGVAVSVLPKCFAQRIEHESKVQRLLGYLGTLLFVSLRRGKTLVAHSLQAWPLALAALFARKKCFWLFHEAGAPHSALPIRPMRYVRKFYQKGRLHFWFGSKAMQEEFGKANFSGHTVCFNGKVVFMPNKEKIRHILLLEAHEPKSGAHLVLEAFLALIRDRRIPEGVNLILDHKRVEGLARYVSDLILKVHQAEAQNRVHFKNQNREESLTHADLFVQASTMECLPFPLLRAMACGLPIIATHIKGHTEALEHNYNALLFRPRNVEDLALCLEEAINNHEKSFKLGKEAQKTFSERFEGRVEEMIEMTRD